MKLRLAAVAFVLAIFNLLPGAALAQSYTINWYKIAGGGGTSTSGTYTVSGTIGQPDASGVMSGGNYSLTGGFWSMIQVVQTPGAPALNISVAGNVTTVYWPISSGWNLRQSPILTTPIASWVYSSGVTQNGGTNYVILTGPVGNMFFRLTNP